jgi:ATP synthase F1 gamma subunit
MANVLDLRRRIRSVKNTRQITKAMKMVSAAKLRRAQERAMQARPYAQMLTNVLESLVRRTDLYNAETGEIMHPLLVEREEKNVLVIVIAGDKGFAGGFNSNIGKAAQKFHRRAHAPGARTSTSSPSARRRSASTRSVFLPPTTRRRKSTTTTISPRTTRHPASRTADRSASEHPTCF